MGNLAKTTRAKSKDVEVASLTREQRESIKAHFHEVGKNARAQIVMTMHLQGMTKGKMAELLDVTESTIAINLAQAIEQVRQEMHLLPEGQLLMTQIVIDGYMRNSARILEVANRRLSVALMEGIDGAERRIDDGLVIDYLNVLAQTNERMANMMMKMGVTMMAKKETKKPKEKDDFRDLEDVIEEISREEKNNAGVELAIVGAVERDTDEGTPLDESFEEGAS